MKLDDYRQIRNFLECAYDVLENSRIGTPSGKKKPFVSENDKLLLEQIVDSISLANALMDETVLEKLLSFWPDLLVRNSLTSEELENAKNSRSFSEWKILNKKLLDYKAGLSTEKGV